jgi:hypothetical protein
MAWRPHTPPHCMKAGAITAPALSLLANINCECRKNTATTCRNCNCFGQCGNKLEYKTALCCSTQDTILRIDESQGPVVIMMNITPQSTQTDDDPTSTSEPWGLELGDKSKGIPLLQPIAHQHQLESRTNTISKKTAMFPAPPFLVVDQKTDLVYGDHVHQHPSMHTLWEGSLTMPSDKSSGDI